MELQLIVISSRALILILNTIIGGICIYLGWRLYFEAIRIESKVEINSGSIKLIVQSAAPGLFFVAFGIFLLIYVLQQKVELQLHDVNIPENSSQVKYINPQVKYENYRIIKTNEKKKIQKNNCYFNEKYLSLKWADQSDPRTNKEKIHEALEYAQINLLEKIKVDEVNDENFKISNTISILKSIDLGFQNNEN